MTIGSEVSPTVDTANRGIGSSERRPDGIAKVTGAFAYSSDLHHHEMLWGVTVRSPHPYARIRGINISDALATPGVSAVLTHENVPGENCFGLETSDQPVLAESTVRYVGEAVVLVAADHPESARRAAARVRVDYEILEPLVDAEIALKTDTAAIHPDGNLIRHLKIRRGSIPQAPVVVRGVYEVGMQDQAFLGPESCLAIPEEDGGLQLYCSTQWLHVDQAQLAKCLGLPKELLRLTLSGVGGAFGGKEDLSVQAHACMLAMATGKPIKMSYGREESFSGHVHRHPARMEFEHGANTDGELLYVRARIVLDGGAYASTSAAVVGNAGCFAVGPYSAPNVHVDCFATRTNNPPCGAMRGFGALQVAFAYESQMDKLALALGVDPVTVRLINALETGSIMPTGQRVEGPAPVRELLRRVEAMPVPKADDAERDYRSLPGGLSNTTRGEGIRRGTGYAVSIKSICKSAGYDDYATAKVSLRANGATPVAHVHTAAAEVGQGLVTVQAQIVRTELAVEDVVVVPADTQVGDAGTSSASRQTWMSGGAVKTACEAIRAELLSRAATELGLEPSDLSLVEGFIVTTEGSSRIPIIALLGEDIVEDTAVYRHRETSPLDPVTGQGDAHVAYGFAAHRAIVDVDVELGLVRVVEIACAEDVGKAMNPSAIEGQMQGAIAQGVGLALMEELTVTDGVIQNPSFTDYLIPTILDMPNTRLDILEYPRPDSPYGLTGVGEPPLLSTPPAIVAAIRDACGIEINKIPVRPDVLCGRTMKRSL